MLEMRFPVHASVRPRRVRLSSAVGISYGITGGGRFGDCIRSVQQALAASERLGCLIGVYPWGVGNFPRVRPWLKTAGSSGRYAADVVSFLLERLPAEGKLELIAPDIPSDRVPFTWGKYIHVPTFNPEIMTGEHAANEYVKFKHAWKPGPYGRMCYQFYGVSYWWRQSIRREEGYALLNSLPPMDRVRVGLPMTLAQSLEVMYQSDFFVGIDSGMSHMARCLGIPTFINPKRVPMDWFYRWHKKDSPSYTLFRTNAELLERLRERLPWIFAGV